MNLFRNEQKFVLPSAVQTNRLHCITMTKQTPICVEEPLISRYAQPRHLQGEVRLVSFKVLENSTLRFPSVVISECGHVSIVC